MKASVGDRIVIHAPQLDRPVRTGEIVECQHEDGSPPYVVRWSESGQTGLFFPGPDARIEPAAGGGSAPSGQPETGSA